MSPIPLYDEDDFAPESQGYTVFDRPGSDLLHQEHGILWHGSGEIYSRDQQVREAAPDHNPDYRLAPARGNYEGDEIQRIGLCHALGVQYTPPSTDPPAAPSYEDLIGL